MSSTSASWNKTTNSTSPFLRTGGSLRRSGLQTTGAGKILTMRNVKDRDQLETSWDNWLESRACRTAFRFDGSQRRALRRFFNMMDIDGGGTIDVSELESPLLSTGLVTNHRELQELMDRIDKTGKGEINFWDFISAFKPVHSRALSESNLSKSKGKRSHSPVHHVTVGRSADMKKLREILATVDHETLQNALDRDREEDDLSDAEEKVKNLWDRRREAQERSKMEEVGYIPESAVRWYERLSAPSRATLNRLNRAVNDAPYTPWEQEEWHHHATRSKFFNPDDLENTQRSNAHWPRTPGGKHTLPALTERSPPPRMSRERLKASQSALKERPSFIPGGGGKMNRRELDLVYKDTIAKRDSKLGNTLSGVQKTTKVDAPPHLDVDWVETQPEKAQLNMATKIGVHRRRFLLATIMQEKERYAVKRSDLLSHLKQADLRHDAVEASAIRDALRQLDAAHSRRVERLAATALVISKERENPSGRHKSRFMQDIYDSDEDFELAEDRLRARKEQETKKSANRPRRNSVYSYNDVSRRRSVQSIDVDIPTLMADAEKEADPVAKEMIAMIDRMPGYHALMDECSRFFASIAPDNPDETENDEDDEQTQTIEEKKADDNQSENRNASSYLSGAR